MTRNEATSNLLFAFVDALCAHLAVDERPLTAGGVR